MSDLEEIAKLTDIAYQQGRADAFKEMINKCNKYSYICHSDEFAKVLEEWMNEDKEQK